VGQKLAEQCGAGGAKVIALSVGIDRQRHRRIVAVPERLAVVREHVRAEASRRRADCRAEAGVAISRMQQRGETLATIAELAGLGIGEIRAMLRYAPKPERHAASGGSVHQFAMLKAGEFQPGFMHAATRPRAALRWCSKDSVGCQSGRFS
jgi:hypothetical protein